MENVLVDNFGRKHTYLRISLTEKCNLRCVYCMPKEGVTLTPKSQLMSADEIYNIAKIFVNQGVNKIRLTGGEPLVRKDFFEILHKLSSLPVEINITTNAISIDRHFEKLKQYRVNKINVSLDTLNEEKFEKITLRNAFKEVYHNIFKLLENDFSVKINVVLMKNENDDEILDFIALTESHPLDIRFIEFMPFTGNNWNRSKTVGMDEILEQIATKYSYQSLENEPNESSKNFKIQNALGRFGIISTVTHPFCDTCNRIRLTANGKLKNCLFSQKETDILTAFRNGEDIEPLIKSAILGKFAVRSGMQSLDIFNNPEKHSHNRTMITIGG